MVLGEVKAAYNHAGDTGAKAEARDHGEIENVDHAFAYLEAKSRMVQLRQDRESSAWLATGRAQPMRNF